MILATTLDHDSLYAIGKTEKEATTLIRKALTVQMKRLRAENVDLWEGMNASQWMEYVGVNYYDLSETGVAFESGYAAAIS